MPRRAARASCSAAARLPSDESVLACAHPAVTIARLRSEPAASQRASGSPVGSRPSTRQAILLPRTSCPNAVAASRPHSKSRPSAALHVAPRRGAWMPCSRTTVSCKRNVSPSTTATDAASASMLPDGAGARPNSAPGRPAVSSPAVPLTTRRPMASVRTLGWRDGLASRPALLNKRLGRRMTPPSQTDSGAWPTRRLGPAQPRPSRASCAAQQYGRVLSRSSPRSPWRQRVPTAAHR